MKREDKHRALVAADYHLRLAQEALSSATAEDDDIYAAYDAILTARMRVDGALDQLAHEKKVQERRANK